MISCLRIERNRFGWLCSAQQSNSLTSLLTPDSTAPRKMSDYVRYDNQAFCKQVDSYQYYAAIT
jgi:hypothetical protein